jgi:SAM-dependent methyltransferase
VWQLPEPDPSLVHRLSAEVYPRAFALSPAVARDLDAVRLELARFAYWHYAIDLGQDIWTRRPTGQEPHPQDGHFRRFLHVFSGLLTLTGGSLDGLRVLDIACNAGFWSILARRLGARYVLGIDRSEQNVEQARCLARLTGVRDVEFETADAFAIEPAWTRPFDVCLFLGLLYHLPDPICALRRVYVLTGRWAAIDTRVSSARGAVLELSADRPKGHNHPNGLRVLPSEPAVELMLQYVGFRKIIRLPDTSPFLHDRYRSGRRVTYIACK